MGLPYLDNLVRIRQLKSEPSTPGEIEGLLRSGKARLKDAQLQTLSLDSRFDLGYNAAHAFSLAALRWHGYPAAVRCNLQYEPGSREKLHLPTGGSRIINIL